MQRHRQQGEYLKCTPIPQEAALLTVQKLVQFQWRYSVFPLHYDLPNPIRDSMHKDAA